MGTGWRRAFCSTVPRDRDRDTNTRRDAAAASTMDNNPSPKKLFARSNPSTPRLSCNTNTSNSPRLNCKTTPTTPRSTSSSPRSPFSILRNTLRSSKNSCGVCMQSVKKTSQGMAVYTAACSHMFHFPCIASHVRRNQNNDKNLICPVCSTIWKDVPLLSIHRQNHLQQHEQENNHTAAIDSMSNTPTKRTPISSPRFIRQDSLKSYADDEPLVTPKAAPSKFIPIPEANEQFEDDSDESAQEFQGFLVNPISSSDDAFNRNSRNVEVSILPVAAVICAGRTHETYAVVLKIKAPPPPLRPRGDAASRAPIDLVTVLDVSLSMSGAKLQMLQRAMRLVISSLGPVDRLSIVTFSAAPKRVLPLTRMTAHGQGMARRMVDRLCCSQGTSMAEALKQATKVLEDRRERNPVASIILLSDGQDDTVQTANNNNNNSSSRTSTTTTRFAHVEIPVNDNTTSSPLSDSSFHRDEDAFSKCVGGLLSVVVQDFKIQLGFAPGSDPAEITAVYTSSSNGGGRPTVLNPACMRIGDLYAEEEREIMIEIRAPLFPNHNHPNHHHVFTVNCCYKDPATQELVYGRNQALLLPRPIQASGGLAKIERIRNAFIATRAVAESRRLVEHDELWSAAQLLSSARALLLQSRLSSPSSEGASSVMEECVRGIDTELAEVEWRRRYQCLDIGEPISAAKAAAQFKKRGFERSVSDLHGFENARF